MFGKAAEAREKCDGSARARKGQRSRVWGGLCTGSRGRFVPSPGFLANDLEARYPKDTAVRFSYLPALRGLLALSRREPSRAIDLLQSPRRMSWANRAARCGFSGSLYPVYVRGETYLAAQPGGEAAAEFPKVLDHRGMAAAIRSAHSRIYNSGRILCAGDTKAKAAYQDFLSHWKDADPEIPIFQQAKPEYARLR